MTREDSLRENGYVIFSPVSGSMKAAIPLSMADDEFVPPKYICK